MTRTERSHSLRALLKDRSEARNGMDSSLPKGGAGAHNWGSLEREFDYENAAIADEAAEFDDQGADADASKLQPNKPTPVRRTSNVTDEDRENAIKIRTNALKSNGQIDLVEIARSSVAISSSPPKDKSITASIF